MLFRKNFGIIIILIITAFLRFYNLLHDSPYFFNPDERNMAIAITRFILPGKLSAIPTCLISEFFPKQLDARRYTLNAQNCSLNPHFFAYGQFPMYLAFISDQATKPFSNFFSKKFTTNLPAALSAEALAEVQVRTLAGNRFTRRSAGVGGSLDEGGQLTTNFTSAIYWLRFWSALSSTATVLTVYLIARQLLTINYSLLTTSLAAFTPGLIQSAHFGTTESLLTFFFIAVIYLSIKLIESLSVKNLSKYPASATASARPRKYAAAGSRHWRDLILISLSIGISLGAKLTALLFLFPPFLALLLKSVQFSSKKKRGLNIFLLGVNLPFKEFIKLTSFGLFILGLSLIIFFISSPYNLVEFRNFKSAVFGYESDVALGKYEAFYTRQFVNTQSILFQAEKIFPYALGWPVFVLGVLGFLLMNLKLIQYAIFSILRKYQKSKIPSPAARAGITNIKKSKIFNILYVPPQRDPAVAVIFLIFNFSFLIYLIPNSFLYAKWTRFMTPIFPFFAIFTGYFLYYIVKLFSRKDFLLAPNNRSSRARGWKPPARGKIYLGLFIICYLLFSLSPGLAFMSIYTNEDSRLTASKWIYDNLPNNSYVLSETANVVDIPLGIPNYRAPTPNYTVISFDFYHLDERPELYPQLINHLEKSNYIFIPSRRIFKNFLRLPERYKLVKKYYQLLFSAELGFESVTEFSSYPSIYLGPINIRFPDEDAEETFTVFDHPVVRIYKKVTPLTKTDYHSLFMN